MLDLKKRYNQYQEELNNAALHVLQSGQYILGQEVVQFESALSKSLDNISVISCANGTDAITLALLALELQPGDEVIVPNFGFIAPAEAVALLGLTPIFADVDPLLFTLSAETIAPLISLKTRAIIPIHLFGQCAPMEEILKLSRQHELAVIEDTAQAFGATQTFSDGTTKAAGTMGTIGCTSFFPSKNIGGFGDGGAVFTHDKRLAEKIRALSRHGSLVKYHHQWLGINSRLDTIQAALLQVVLKHENEIRERRITITDRYQRELIWVNNLELPATLSCNTHTYHQFTVRIKNNQRDTLKQQLEKEGISSMIYYPQLLSSQPAFEPWKKYQAPTPVALQLTNEALSLSVNPWMEPDVCNRTIALIHEILGEETFDPLDRVESY